MQRAACPLHTGTRTMRTHKDVRIFIVKGTMGLWQAAAAEMQPGCRVQVNAVQQEKANAAHTNEFPASSSFNPTV